MTYQPGLFDAKPKAGKTAAFEAFHAENGWVYEAFKRRALALIQRGERRRYSAGTIVDLMRWHDPRSTTTADLPEGFKIANAHSAFYGRMFLMEFPEHREFFRLHAAEADEWPGPPGWRFSGRPVRSGETSGAEAGKRA